MQRRRTVGKRRLAVQVAQAVRWILATYRAAVLVQQARRSTATTTAAVAGCAAGRCNAVQLATVQAGRQRTHTQVRHYLGVGGGGGGGTKSVARRQAVRRQDGTAAQNTAQRNRGGGGGGGNVQLALVKWRSGRRCYPSSSWRKRSRPQDSATGTVGSTLHRVHVNGFYWWSHNGTLRKNRERHRA
jgi:hypothetical protein